MENIDIIQYLRILYKKKLLLFMAGMAAGAVGLAAGAVQPALHQATVSVKLNQNSANVFAQNNVVTVVRSQDIRPQLKGLGLVKMTLRQKHGRSAYMDIGGQAFTPRTAKRLAGEAALAFLARSRLLDAERRQEGGGLTEILGEPKPAKAVYRELPERTVLAAAIGSLAAATVLVVLIYVGENNEHKPPMKRAMHPIAK